MNERHLNVLWGEIGRFIQTAKQPLTRDKGGPLVVNHREIKKYVNGKLCTISYLVGCVSAKGEGMAGHHAEYTLAVFDEASGIDDEVFNQADGWSKRRLIFGNPNNCNNRFRRAVKEGDIPMK